MLPQFFFFIISSLTGGGGKTLYGKPKLNVLWSIFGLIDVLCKFSLYLSITAFISESLIMSLIAPFKIWSSVRNSSSLENLFFPAFVRKTMSSGTFWFLDRYFPSFYWYLLNHQLKSRPRRLPNCSHYQNEDLVSHCSISAYIRYNQLFVIFQVGFLPLKQLKRRFLTFVVCFTNQCKNGSRHPSNPKKFLEIFLPTDYILSFPVVLDWTFQRHRFVDGFQVL